MLISEGRATNNFFLRGTAINIIVAKIPKIAIISTNLGFMETVILWIEEILSIKVKIYLQYVSVIVSGKKKSENSIAKGIIYRNS